MSKHPVAIVFDTFGTVVDWRGSLIADLTGFGKERGITADWTAPVDARRAAYHPSIARVPRGKPSLHGPRAQGPAAVDHARQPASRRARQAGEGLPYHGPRRGRP